MDIDKNVLNKFLECDWFSNCGTKENTSYDFEYKLTSDYNVVLKGIENEKWHDICLEKRYEDAFKLQRKRSCQTGRWNNQIKFVEENYIPGLDKIIRSKIKEFNLSEELIENIMYDILIIFTFEMFRDIGGYEFYYNYLQIYLSGHIPCNWSGSRVSGRIVVY